MSNISCIVVEDEPLAVKVLTDYISQIPFLVLQGTFKDALLATEHLRANPVGLIFLDIHLPKLKGMAFLKTLTHPPAVIITTAYHQYAVEGFDLNVADYLLKPFSFERFLKAVNKVQVAQGEGPSFAEASAGTTSASVRTLADKSADEKDFIFVNTQKKKVKILFADIVYVESQREYVKIATTKQDYVSKMSTHEIEALLPPQTFKRVHRSFIVSLDKIEAYTAEAVELSGGAQIPVGRGYREVLEGL